MKEADRRAAGGPGVCEQRFQRAEDLRGPAPQGDEKSEELQFPKHSGRFKGQRPAADMVAVRGAEPP